MKFRIRITHLIKLDCMTSKLKVYFNIILQGFTLAGCHLELNYSDVTLTPPSNRGR